MLSHPKSFAGFWDNLGSCLSNPCNCGYGKRIERWNGMTFDKGDENPLCPPWNKGGGRGDNTCIANTDYPKIFIPWYLSYCAESTAASNYFSPKIRVRYQACNVACWGLDTVLNWDGECIIWPSGYALPMLRICARVAVPERESDIVDPGTGARKVYPPDPGYTRGKHLNREGFEENDDPIELEDGTTILIDRPKLCAYKDPSLYDIVTFTVDLMDFKPLNQAIHNTGGVHPIAEAIIFIVESLSGAAGSIGTLLGSLLDTVGGVIIPGLDLFKVIFEAVGEIVKYIKDVLVAALKELGQFNRVVDNYKFGCVEIPIGPYPPPYCPRILPFVPNAITQPICQAAADGTPIKTTRINKCVISTKVNNLIRNTVRISFDNLVPECKSGIDPNSTDKCITFSNLGGIKSAGGVHFGSARRDIIRKCISGSGLTPCVNTQTTEPSSGFRVVYGLKTGTRSTPISYYVEDNGQEDHVQIPDCNTTSDTTCQEIWGINTGEFVDTSLVFPIVETPNSVAPLISPTVTLKDMNGTNRSFNVSIVRNAVYDSATDFTQSPNQICVSEGTSIIGCEQRSQAIRPSVYSCSSPPVPGILCTDNHFTPRFIASLSNGSDSTNVVVEVPNVHNASSTDKVNLAGYSYEAFATDDNFITQPFPISPKSFNSASIYGSYMNNKAPYDASGNTDATAVYLSGLEYVNGKYIEGAKYSCLNLIDIEKCPLNQPMCVLSNLLNRDIVNCADFLNKAQQRPNLTLCTSKDTGCTSVDSLAGKNGGKGITIYECTAGPIRSYCYKNDTNTEVCQVSFKPSDRYNPSAGLGNFLADSQFFPASIDMNQKPLQYDPNLYGLRDKTSIEMNLCTATAQLFCAAVSTPSLVNGYAAWPETIGGEQATGTCLPGYILQDASKPLKRYCLVNAASRSVGFEAIPAGGGCIGQTVEFIRGDSNFPADFPYVQFGDKKEGGVEFGKADEAHKVYASTAGEVFFMNLTFNVTRASELEYFRITKMTYDDYVVVKVNNNKVYGDADDISKTPNIERGTFWDVPNPIDLTSQIKDGSNLIRIDIKVIGGGILYYQIDYKFKN